jgi:hypothetical protein
MPLCFAATLAAAAGGDRNRRFWRPTLHPERIETESFYSQKLDYLHDNPSRKGAGIAWRALAVFVGFLLGVRWKSD